MKYWLARNKVMIFLLMILVILFNGCNKTYSIKSNSSVDAANKNSAADGSGTSSDLSKEMDEFYQAWNQEQIKLSDNAFVNYYYLIRDKSDTLLIYLEGSGDQSVMGVKEGGIWIRGGNPYSFAKKRFPDYDFLTMDNVNVTMGGDHFMDPAVTNEYTFDNRVKSAVTVIDTFLNNSKKNYKDVIIFGISQGGQILPRVYLSLQRKNDITKLIALGSGGLSQYEDFMILKDSDLPMEPGFKEGYAAIEEAYPDIQKHPDSVERQYFGYSYKMWHGFLNYKPLDDYMNIDIPILLLHGAKDFNSSVESARAVETEFKAAGKINLKYIEYPDMGHGPESKEQSEQLFGDINNWLEENNTN